MIKLFQSHFQLQFFVLIVADERKLFSVFRFLGTHLLPELDPLDDFRPQPRLGEVVEVALELLRVELWHLPLHLIPLPPVH